MKAARGRGCEVSDGHGGVSGLFQKTVHDGCLGASGHAQELQRIPETQVGPRRHRTKLPEARPLQETLAVWGDPDLSPSSGEPRT